MADSVSASACTHLLGPAGTPRELEAQGAVMAMMVPVAAPPPLVVALALSVGEAHIPAVFRFAVSVISRQHVAFAAANHPNGRLPVTIRRGLRRVAGGGARGLRRRPGVGLPARAGDEGGKQRCGEDGSSHAYEHTRFAMAAVISRARAVTGDGSPT